MRESIYKTLLLVAVRAFAAALAFTLVMAASLMNSGGCSNVRGRDVSRTSDRYTTASVATTQSTGGEQRKADYTASVTVSPEQIRVEAVDHKSASTQPNVVTVQHATQGGERIDDKDIGPQFNGVPSGKISVDGLSVQAVESKLKSRWPIAAVFVLVGLFYFLMPPPKGSTVTAIGFFAAAAAALVASDLLFLSVCAVAILIPLWPHLRNAELLTRVKGQLDDWISDAPPHEQLAFGSSMKIAAGRHRKLLDKIGLEAVHSGKVTPVPPVPNAGK